MATTTFRVGEREAGERTDALLATRITALSRSLAARLSKEGKVRVNGVPVKPSHRVSAGDVVSADVEPSPSLHAAPEDIPLRIVYRDADLAVIEKPPGMVVHPAA